MGKLIKNRKATKFTLIGLIAAAILLAAGLMLMSVFNNGEASAANGSNAVTVENLAVDSSDKYAKELFGCKIEDINDTAAIAKLLETMKIESVTGEYTVKISTEGDIKVLSLNVTESVQEPDKKTFDDNMQKCAEQMLALIPGVGKVQWNYSVVSTDAKEESASISLDEAGATKELGSDVRKYGKSANKLQKLLAIQEKSE